MKGDGNIMNFRNTKNDAISGNYQKQEKYTPRIGYACMNLDTFPNSFRTCRKEKVTEERLYEIISHNIEVLEAMIDYNLRYENRMFRISSSLIPFASSPLNTLDWKTIFKDRWNILKDRIREGDIRISCHPGQYTVINSPDDKVVRSSIEELEYHADLMELLSGDSRHKMILHIGGVYGDKERAAERFIEVYNSKISEKVKKYLVIENDERLYTVSDILIISSKTGIPVVFDNLHHRINPSMDGISTGEIISRVAATWKGEDGRPKIHYSQQAEGKREGAHSETISAGQFIKDYKEIYSRFAVDIMLEVKDKNRSFRKIDLLLNPSQRKLEDEWKCYKYTVLSKSQKVYSEIREMLKEKKKPDIVRFYTLIESLGDIPYDRGNEENALLHVWGYFKKETAEKEKNTFFRKLESFRRGKTDAGNIKKFLFRLSEKYGRKYLSEGYYLKQV